MLYHTRGWQKRALLCFQWDRNPKGRSRNCSTGYLLEQRVLSEEPSRRCHHVDTIRIDCLLVISWRFDSTSISEWHDTDSNLHHNNLNQACSATTVHNGDDPSFIRRTYTTAALRGWQPEYQASWRRQSTDRDQWPAYGVFHCQEHQTADSLGLETW